MNPKPHRGRGNQNAAKAPGKKRVTLSLRVLPETKERLKRAAEAYGSMSRAVDAWSQHFEPTYAVYIRLKNGAFQEFKPITEAGVREVTRDLPEGAEVKISEL